MLYCIISEVVYLYVGSSSELGYFDSDGWLIIIIMICFPPVMRGTVNSTECLEY